jgi:diguanylate cyclase (GGDEF)-like protein
LVTLDLDYFKQVNDTFGHAAGDTLLKEFGKRIVAGLRNTDSAARFGGDEFAIVYTCKKGTERQTADHVMKRFYNNLTPPVDLGNIQYNIKSSVGVAFFPEHATDIPTLFERADTALYQSKQNGKNQYSIWKPAFEPPPK